MGIGTFILLIALIGTAFFLQLKIEALNKQDGYELDRKKKLRALLVIATFTLINISIFWFASDLADYFPHIMMILICVANDIFFIKTIYEHQQMRLLMSEILLGPQIISVQV